MCLRLVSRPFYSEADRPLSTHCGHARKSCPTAFAFCHGPHGCLTNWIEIHLLSANRFRRNIAITANIRNIRAVAHTANPFSLNLFAAKPSRMGRKFFGTDGIRGRANVAPLTAEVASS